MKTAQQTDTTLRRLSAVALLLCAVVVVLGAYVRLTHAGLGCPDWPGCYGHLTPEGAAANPQAQAAFPHAPLHMGKAWREMLHRYAATLLGVLIVIIAAVTLRARRYAVIRKRFVLSLLGIVVLQGMLGMLTVTWSLKPLIVTLHLLFGFTTLGLLWWLWLSLNARRLGGERRLLAPTPRSGAWGRHRAHTLAILALILLGWQIALGGWTSTNYAAVACPDFPRCQNEWWPDSMNYSEAFVLWRGLGINYEGGILDHPARVAIHFTHRLGAIVVTLMLLWAAVFALRSPGSRAAKNAAYGVLGALALQLIVGISMVIKTFPLSLATAHNAGAAVLFLATLALCKYTRESG
jgi:heme a synthase